MLAGKNAEMRTIRSREAKDTRCAWINITAKWLLNEKDPPAKGANAFVGGLSQNSKIKAKDPRWGLLLWKRTVILIQIFLCQIFLLHKHGNLDNATSFAIKSKKSCFETLTESDLYHHIYEEPVNFKTERAKHGQKRTG